MTMTVQTPPAVRVAVLLGAVSEVLDVVQCDADGLMAAAREHKFHDQSAADVRAELDDLWAYVERAARATRRAVEWKRDGANLSKDLEDAHTACSLASRALRSACLAARFTDVVSTAMAVASADASVTCLLRVVARARGW